MKGVSGGAVVLILLILVVVGYLFLSGAFTGQQCLVNCGTVSYSNNVISLENKIVSVVNPISGSKTNIEFNVKNNGDKTVNDVSVDFGNPAGFSAVNLDCGTGAQKKSATSCSFNLDSLDDRKIVTTLTAASFSSLTTVDIFYKIEYPYSGSRSGMIPVLGKNVASLPPGISFTQAPGTIGPVQATIQPPVGALGQQGGATSHENFAKEGRQFHITFDIQNIGNAKQVILAKQKILTLDGADIEACNKLDNSGMMLGDEKLPLTVQCTLTPTFTNIELYKFINVNVNYQYDYTLQFTDRFTILPKTS